MKTSFTTYFQAASQVKRKAFHKRSLLLCCFITMLLHVTSWHPLSAQSLGTGGASNHHSLAVSADGKSYSWGYGGYGQLGNGKAGFMTLPQDISSSGALAGKNIISIAAGQSHSLALASDGTVYAWGYGVHGQLGNGSTSNNATPVQSSSPSGVSFMAVAAGAFHTLALASDGSVYAWGYGGHGQLGTGSTSSSATPVQISSPSGVTFTAIAAGGYNSFALASDGTVYAWGYGVHGQLGTGSTSSSATPVQISSPSGVTFTAIAAGDNHSMALALDGTVYAWGYGGHGQLGTGSTSSSATPVQISSPSGVTFTAIAAGANHSLALVADGTTYAWGHGVYGQLGNGSTTNSSTPVKVTNSSGVTFKNIAASGSHSLAQASDGTVYAWGYGGHGQLGDGSTSNSNTPVQVSSPSGVTFTALAVGGNHSLALASDGAVYAWGSNWNGELGLGSYNTLLPQDISSSGVLAGKNIISIAAGQTHSLALASDGTVYAWGYGVHGQLGTGSTSSSATPVQISSPSGVTFMAIAAGAFHSLALSSDGTVYAWGHGFYGQLGNGSTSSSSMPVKVSSPSGVTFTGITAGLIHSLALASDGTTYAWGHGGHGQLGNGSTSSSSMPVKVSSPSGVTFTAIAAGANHSLALVADGTTYAWGHGVYGQLGNGSTSSSSMPVKISSPSGVTFTGIAAGLIHSLALASDGTTYAWGHGGHGQLGNGSTSNNNTPVQVSSPSGVTFTALAAGSYHSLALALDGSVYAWGRSIYGQLGNGSTSSSSTPVKVLNLNLGAVCTNPVPSFTVDNPCLNEVVQFTNTSSQVAEDATYLWDFGDGSTSSTQVSVTHTYTTAGTYTVQLTITQGTCSDSYSHEVEVKALPTAILSGDATICADGSTDLTVAVTGTAPWSVTYTDGTTPVTVSATASPLVIPVSPASTTSYTLTAVSDADCDATSAFLSGSATVTVNTVPVLTVPTISAVSNEAGKCGAVVDLEATATGTPTPDITYTIGDDPEVVPTASYFFPVGTTTVKAIAANSCGTDEKTFTVTVTDDEVPVIASVAPIAVGTDEGECSASVSFATTVSDNCDASVAPVFTLADGTVITSPYVFPENETTIYINASDVAGNAAGQESFTVTVINQLPDPSLVTPSTIDPIQINTGISTSASFTDNNVSGAIWNWGDGSTSPGSISGTSVSGSHIYSLTGVYTVPLTLTDACGESGTSAPYQYVVVYDPNGGFVTGGGWINSPEGAYAVDPSLVGKASFGFVSKYKKGATVPDGNTQFEFKAGDLNFKSTAYEWLVISGYKAQYKGEGTINEGGRYGFMLSAVDGAKKSSTEPDRFRIKIWDYTSGAVVYDNQMNAPDDAEATTNLGGGSIVIHDGSKSSSKNSREVTVDVASEATVAVASIEGFAAYPNPLSQEGLWLEFPAMGNKGEVKAYIYDMSGRILAEKAFAVEKEGSKLLWNVEHSNWSSGIYLLLIQGEKSVQKVNLMKQ